MITEDQLEQLAIERFQDTGWSRANGEELLERLLKDFQDARKRNEDLGLNPDEIAFYDAAPHCRKSG